MRMIRTILAAIFTVALAIPFAACETQETQFEETPAAEEETEVLDREPMQEEPMMQEDRPMEQQPGATDQQNRQDGATRDGDTM